MREDSLTLHACKRNGIKTSHSNTHLHVLGDLDDLQRVLGLGDGLEDGARLLGGALGLLGRALEFLRDTTLYKSCSGIN